MTGSAKPIRVGEALLNEGLVSEEQLQKALAEQKSTGRKLGELLVEQEVISGTTLIHALARCLNVRGCHLRHGLIDPALFELVGEEEAERLKAIPMFKVHDTITVAMAAPQSLPTIDRLRSLTSCRIRPVMALEANISEFIKKYAGGDVNVDSFLTSLAESDVEVVEREAVDEGPATDLGIQAKEMLRTRERLYKIMVEHTGQKIETIAGDCERDKWLDAEEAVAYGTADEVLSHIPHDMGVEKRQNDD